MNKKININELKEMGYHVITRPCETQRDIFTQIDNPVGYGEEFNFDLLELPDIITQFIYAGDANEMDDMYNEFYDKNNEVLDLETLSKEEILTLLETSNVYDIFTDDYIDYLRQEYEERITMFEAAYTSFYKLTEEQIQKSGLYYFWYDDKLYLTNGGAYDVAKRLEYLQLISTETLPKYCRYFEDENYFAEVFGENVNKEIKIFIDNLQIKQQIIITEYNEVV